MILPEWARLILYMIISILPVWQDFFTKSTDYSLRGLAMPIIASLMAAATVVLARTKSTVPDGTNEAPPPASEEPVWPRVSHSSTIASTHTEMPRNTTKTP